MSLLAERLLQARLDKGLTQDKVAKKAGVTRIAISNIELGISKDVRSSNLFPIAHILGVNPEWLATGKGSPILKQSYIEQGPAVHQMVPEINWDQAVEWETTANKTAISDDKYHPCPEKCSSLAYALRVRDDSMQFRFEKGDLIFVDPEKTEPQNGQFVVAFLRGSNITTFKQFIELDGKRMLKALNPDYPSEIRFTPIDESCRIFGTIIGHVDPVL